MSDAGVSLCVTYGFLAQASLSETLGALLKEGPVIVWCEPAPGKERLPDFPGLWVGNIDGFSHWLGGGHPLIVEETRLFWRGGWLHLLVSRGRMRWAAFQEHEGKDRPGDPVWLGPLGATAVGRPTSWTGLVRRSQDVALIRDRDLARYGLKHLRGRLPEWARLVQYRQGTMLIGWTLEVENGTSKRI
jgi:hypothetical protein